MTPASPISPRLVRGGIVTMDPDTSAVQSVIALQYNPDTLTRTLQIQAVAGGQEGVRVDALRPRRSTVERNKKEAEAGLFAGKNGDKAADFEKAKKNFLDALSTWTKQLSAVKKQTDCVGKTIDDFHKGEPGWKKVC